MKSKWIVAILIVALPLLLAACGIKVVVVGTPTPKPTALPTATRTLPPTLEPTATPAPTSTPMPEPTSVPTAVPQASPTLPANLPTPAPKINLKEVGDRLWSQASFAFDLQWSKTDPALHLQGKWVREPRSWYVSRIAAMDAGGSLSGWEYSLIGSRSWFTYVEGNFPTSCADWQQQPADSAVYSACKAGTSGQTIVQGTLDVTFLSGEAEHFSGPTMVDGVSCYEYQWRDALGISRLWLAADTGLPILLDIPFEDYRIALHLGDFNDPNNMFALPASEMPLKLHLDDARMALDGLSSFRYVTTEEIVTADKTGNYRMEGVYVQVNQAWQADFRNKPEDPEPLLQFWSMGGQTWQRLAVTHMWFLSADGDSLVKGAAPFGNWPNQPKPQLAVLDLEPGSSRSIAGMSCQDYVSEGVVQSDEGYDVESQVRLCVTPNQSIPLRMELSMTGGGVRVHIVRELSHLDDPANVVEKAE